MNASVATARIAPRAVAPVDAAPRAGGAAKASPGTAPKDAGFARELHERCAAAPAPGRPVEETPAPTHDAQARSPTPQGDAVEALATLPGAAAPAAKDVTPAAVPALPVARRIDLPQDTDEDLQAHAAPPTLARLVAQAAVEPSEAAEPERARPARKTDPDPPSAPAAALAEWLNRPPNIAPSASTNARSSPEKVVSPRTGGEAIATREKPAAAGHDDDVTHGAPPPALAADPTAAVPALAPQEAHQRAATEAARHVETRAEPGLASPMLASAALVAAASAAAPAAAPALPQVALAAPFGTPAFASELAASVSLLARDGVQQARLQLHPAEMGPIAVQIAIDGTQARVDFTAEVAATRHAIEAGLPELASALRESGLTLAGGGVFGQAPSQRQAAQDGGDGRFARLPARDAVADEASSAAVPVRRRVVAGGVDEYA
jgi:flagellar hook-length control protein FliK